MKYLFFLVLSLILTTNCKKDKPVNNTDNHYSNPFTKEGELTILNENGEILKSLEIELADDRAQTEKGLMDRDSMQENRGMLFVFNTPKVQTFYMRNTRFALDLIYISADSVVVDIQHGYPYNENTIPSDTISQYVLEVNYGMSKKWNIKENKSTVRWKNTL